MIVEYPKEIQLCGSKYSLYGVVLHTGSLDNGHYIAFARRA